MFLRKSRRRSCKVVFLVIAAFFSTIAFLTYNFELQQTDLEIQNRISKVRTSTSNDYHLASYQSLLNLTIKEIKFLPSDEVHRHVSIDKVQLFLKKQLKPASPTQYKSIFLFSAIGILSPVNNTLECIALNLWEEQVYRDRNVFCCLLSQGGPIHKTPVTRKSMFLNHSLTAVQVFCEDENNSQLKNNTRPVGVTLTYDIDNCPMDISNYATVQYTRPCLLEVCIAICAKIAYGYVNAEMVVEWMEYHRHMGVSHVVVFTFNLTADALTVLKFYEKQDFVEVLPFDFPAKDAPVHEIGDKVEASWTDEQLTVYDCHARLQGYDFVGVIDLDEFLVPNHGTLQDLITISSKQHPKAASFTFLTEIHALNWGRENVSNSLIPQFTRYSNAMRDRMKVIHIPKHIEQGGIATHEVLPKPGFRRIQMLHQQAVLKHYRPCRKEWIEEGTCFNRTLHRDTRMTEIFKNIDNHIASIKKTLQIHSKFQTFR